MVTALEAAKAMYAALLAGDFDQVYENMAEDCVIEFYGPSSVPYAGKFVGRDKCMVFFDHVKDDVVIHEFSQDEFIASDTQVAVIGHLKLTAVITGRTYETEYAHIIDVRDGKWVRFRDFADTATVAHAFLQTETRVR